VIALIHQQFTSLYFYYWYLSYALPLIIAAVAIGLHTLVDPLIQKKTAKSYILGLTLMVGFLTLFSWQTSSWTGRSGRIARAVDWPINEKGVAEVEFRRGSSLWIATKDGQSIRVRDAYEANGRPRVGR